MSVSGRLTLAFGKLRVPAARGHCQRGCCSRMTLNEDAADRKDSGKKNQYRRVHQDYTHS